jgi:EF-P beta-lysylation protein EpmB
MACLVLPTTDHTQGDACHQEEWQKILAAAITNPADLCRRLQLPAGLAEAAGASQFPLLAPEPFVSRMRPGDAADPLLRQVLPTALETIAHERFTADPLGEAACAADGLLTKYARRALLIVASACAVHCRFCFRRHFPYAADAANVDRALARLAADTTISELILSGGDPLVLGDARLAELAARLAGIPHLARLRIHTRLPILIPQRVTEQLLVLLRGTRLTTLVVVHVNHPAEIDDAVAEALGRLVNAGVPVLSQGVLLRGVNDNADVLCTLYERLVDLRVMPYYLHQLDPVAGAAHFEVPVDEGLRLLDQLRARLPGYAVPRYVRETPGGVSKQELAGERRADSGKRSNRAMPGSSAAFPRCSPDECERNAYDES